MDIEKIETAIEYEFKDKSLLICALTHRSYRFENNCETDNQRLEFLGDAVLSFLLADRIFKKCSAHLEGMLTVTRSSIASGAALAAKAAAFGLGEYLLLGNGEIITGGRKRESNLSDAIEALIGAAYIDGGIEAVSGVFDKLFAADLGKLTDDRWHENPKGYLQYLAQKKYNVNPVYETIEQTGPDHNTKFRVRVNIGESLYAEGIGANKQAAQSAAASALINDVERQE